MKRISSLVILCIMLITPFTTVFAKSFTDVPNSHSTYKEITYLVNKKIIQGYPNGTFQPMATVTNGQAAIMVTRALKLPLDGRPYPPFKDVFSTTSGFKEIAALVDEGIIPKSSYYHPHSPISRASMARMLANAFQLTGRYDKNFIDVPPTHWAYSYISKIADAGITTGYPDGSFGPATSLTRAHFSTFLARALASEFKLPPTISRGMSFGLTEQQVRMRERSRFLERVVKESTVHVVYLAERYQQPTHLHYIFEKNRLAGIAYDFTAGNAIKQSPTELQAVFKKLVSVATEEYGTAVEIVTSIKENHHYFSATWYGKHEVVTIYVDNEQGFTNSMLLHLPY